MSRSRSQSDGSGASFIGVLIVVAVLWWLRWIILAALIIAAVVITTRWFLRRQAQRREAELARLDAIRKRADIQHAQILRGDPAGFFGQYPLPDPELIPAWYTIGSQRG
ncbi:MAG: hypothetical protein ACRDTN_09130 [Mycobacterium sp.]